VIPSAVCRGPLEWEEVLRLRDDAQQARVALRIGADRARLLLGQREAALAEPDAILDRQNRLGERLRLGPRAPEDIEDEPGGRLLTDRR
jgi:hypothetical protein